MKIGLVGLEKSGKTTVFNALTKSTASTDAFSAKKAEPNMAVVDVADPRIDKLQKLYCPKKTSYATIEFVDFVGIEKSQEKKELFSASELALIKTMDALALVLRNFDNELITSAYGKPDPITDLGTIFSELVLSDLIIAEGRLERIEHFRKRGVKNPQQELEYKALTSVIESLNANRPASIAQFSPQERKAIRGFQFLTMKPIMVILNSDETNFGTNSKLLTNIGEDFRVMEFAGRFEMELCQLSEEEALAFMEDLNIEASARDRLTLLAYDLMGYLTFFTVGQDEVKAWTIRLGDTALEAAGAIHSDLARGFIRAECFTYSDLLAVGSEKGLSEKGLLRLEGKDYIVKDGDILSIRFNV